MDPGLFGQIEGAWNTHWGTWSGSKSTDSTLTVGGTAANPTFTYAPLSGGAAGPGTLDPVTVVVTNPTITGGVAIPSIYGTWTEPGQSGDFWFLIPIAGAFSGAWTSGHSSEPGPWYGKKQT